MQSRILCRAQAIKEQDAQLKSRAEANFILDQTCIDSKLHKVGVSSNKTYAKYTLIIDQ